MKKAFIFVLALVFFLLFKPAKSSSADGCDYYVASNGNDSNSGTDINHPLATIGKARDKIRGIGTMTKDIAVCLRGGNYFLNNTISFGPQDSGRNGKTITYKNYANEKPILIGGKKITNWTHHAGSIYKANVGKGWKFYVLMENGEFVTKAREPNKGFRSATGGGEDYIKYASGHYSDFDYNDAQLYIKTGRPAASSRTEWWTDIFPIISINWGDNRINVNRHTSQWLFFEDDRYYLRGSLDFLDQKGEYHLDESSGYLYYWPKKTPIGSQEIIAPKIDRIIELKGSSLTSHVKNIKFEGLTFILTNSYKKFDSHSFDPGINTPKGVVQLENADSIIIQNCKIQNSGDSGIVLSKYAQNNIIDGNLIEKIAGHGILLEGLDEDDTRYVNKNNKISNNRLHNGYLEYGEGSKLWLGYGSIKGAIHLWNSGDNEIVHNEVVHWPDMGINLSSAPFKVIQNEQGVNCPSTGPTPGLDCWDYLHSRNNYIGFNDVSHVMEDASDGGGIYNFGGGRDNIIDNNRVHDISSPVPGLEQGIGIYIDEYSTNWTVKNNIIYNIGGSSSSAMILKGPRNKITNNIVADNPCTLYGEPTHIFAAGKALKDAVITNNIFYRQGGHYLYYFYGWASSKIKKADNNLFYHPGGDHFVRLGHRDGENASFTKWRNMGYDKDSITDDPEFDISQVGGKRIYDLKSNSPALALGFQPIDQSQIGPGGAQPTPTPTPTPPPSLRVIIKRYNTANARADLNGDGLVNGLDFATAL